MLELKHHTRGKRRARGAAAGLDTWVRAPIDDSRSRMRRIHGVRTPTRENSVEPVLDDRYWRRAPAQRRRAALTDRRGLAAVGPQAARNVFHDDDYSGQPGPGVRWGKETRPAMCSSVIIDDGPGQNWNTHTGFSLSLYFKEMSMISYAIRRSLFTRFENDCKMVSHGCCCCAGVD